MSRATDALGDRLVPDASAWALYLAINVGMMGRDPTAPPCVDLTDPRPRLRQFGEKLEHPHDPGPDPEP